MAERGLYLWAVFQPKKFGVKNQRMTVGCWTLVNGPAYIVLGLLDKLNIVMKSNADKLMLPQSGGIDSRFPMSNSPRTSEDYELFLYIA